MAKAGGRWKDRGKPNKRKGAGDSSNAKESQNKTSAAKKRKLTGNFTSSQSKKARKSDEVNSLSRSLSTSRKKVKLVIVLDKDVSLFQELKPYRKSLQKFEEVKKDEEDSKGNLKRDEDQESEGNDVEKNKKDVLQNSNLQLKQACVDLINLKLLNKNVLNQYNLDTVKFKNETIKQSQKNNIDSGQSIACPNTEKSERVLESTIIELNSEKEKFLERNAILESKNYQKNSITSDKEKLLEINEELKDKNNQDQTLNENLTKKVVDLQTENKIAFVKVFKPIPKIDLSSVKVLQQANELQKQKKVSTSEFCQYILDGIIDKISFLSQLQEQQMTFQRKLEDSNEEIKNVKNTTLQLQKEIMKKEVEQTDLQKKVEDLQEEKISFQKKLEDLKEEGNLTNKKALQQQTALQKEIVGLNKEKHNKDDALQKQEVEQVALQKKVTDLQEQHKKFEDLKEEKEKITNEKALLQQTVLQEEKQINDNALQQIKELQEQLDEKNLKINLIESKNEDLMQNNEYLEKELETKKSEFTETVSTCKEQHEKVVRKLETKDSECKKLKSQIKDLNISFQNDKETLLGYHKSDKEKLKEQNKNIVRELEIIKAECTTLFEFTESIKKSFEKEKATLLDVQKTEKKKLKELKKQHKKIVRELKIKDSECKELIKEKGRQNVFQNFPTLSHIGCTPITPETPSDLKPNASEEQQLQKVQHGEVLMLSSPEVEMEEVALKEAKAVQGNKNDLKDQYKKLFTALADSMPGEENFCRRALNEAYRIVYGITVLHMFFHRNFPNLTNLAKQIGPSNHELKTFDGLSFW